MKTQISKSKEILRLITACVLSVVLLSAAFIGFNQLAFATVTNRTEPLPPVASPAAAYVAADVAPTQEMQVNDSDSETYEVNEIVFVPPALTVIEAPWQRYHAIPSSAIAMEDAAQIGARYIWDVFGTNIDGMYVQMMFADHASQTNTWWSGTVFVEHPDNPTINYIVNVYGDERFALPVYSFTINGITGERISISYSGQRGHMPITIPERISAVVVDDEEYDGLLYATAERVVVVGGGTHYMRRISPGEVVEVETYEITSPPGSIVGSHWFGMRTALVESGWFDMDIFEQLAFAEVSDDALKVYTQTAMRLAEAHFNLSTVTNVELISLNVNGIIDGVVDFVALNFAVTDSTGREALIFIPSTEADFGMINISTDHNDFVPGFCAYVPGSLG